MPLSSLHVTSPDTHRERRWLAASTHRTLATRRLASLVAPLMALLIVGTGCDRVKAALKDEAMVEAGDPVWKADSTLLADSPNILFRILDGPQGKVAAPIATIGAQGFRKIRMGRRGWRALDVQFLHADNTLGGLRDGRVVGDLSMTRGMWDAGTQLDSLPGCNRLVPIGLVGSPPAGVRMAVAGARPKLNPVSPLSAGEVQDAVATIPTLIAPSSGIATSVLATYKREIYVLNTGIGPRPTIVAIYNDPVPVSDTLSPMGQRPRQFIVILDKGVYGYKTTYTYTTLGNALSAPRLAWLDFVDVDGDGKAELFFTLKYLKTLDATQVLKYVNDSWKEIFKDGVRCQG